MADVLGGRLRYDIVADATKFEAGMKKVGNSLEKHQANILRAGVAFTAFGAIITGVFVLATKSASDFEYRLAKVATLINNNTVVLAGMNKELKTLAMQRPQSVNELTDALYQAVSAGVEATKAVTFLNDATKLAIGGFTDTTTAVDILTTVINAYGKSVEDAVNVMDILITTQNRGKTTVAEMGPVLARAIPIAAGLGVSFEELAAMIATLTFSGISTEEAIVGIRGAFSSLATPSEDLIEILDGMTISADGLIPVFNKLTEETGASADVLFKLIPEMRAVNAILILTGKGAQRFSEDLVLMGEVAGASQEAFDVMMDTLINKFKTFTSSLDILIKRLGEVFIPITGDLLEMMGGVLALTLKFTEAFPRLTNTIIGLTAAIGALSLAIGGILLLLSGALIVKAAATAGIFTAMATLLTPISGPLIIGFTAMAVAVTLAIAYWNDLKVIMGAVKDLWEKMPFVKEKKMQGLAYSRPSGTIYKTMEEMEAGGTTPTTEAAIFDNKELTNSLDDVTKAFARNRDEISAMQTEYANFQEYQKNMVIGAEKEAKAIRLVEIERARLREEWERNLELEARGFLPIDTTALLTTFTSETPPGVFERIRLYAEETFKDIAYRIKWELENVAFWFNRDILVGNWREIWNNLRNNASDAAADIGAMLMTQLELKAIGGLANALWNVFTSDTAMKAYAWVGSKVWEGMKDLGKWIYDTFHLKIVEDACKWIGEKVWEELRDLGKWIYRELVSPIVKAGCAAFSLILQGFIELGKWIYRELVSPIVSIGCAAFALILQTAITLGKWIYNQLIDPFIYLGAAAFALILQTAITLGKWIVDALQSDWVQTTILWFVGKFSVLWKLAGSIVDALKSGWVWDTIKWFISKFSVLWTLAKSIVDALESSWVWNIIKWFISKFSVLWTLAQSIVDALKSGFVGDAIKWFIAKLAGIWEFTRALASSFTSPAVITAIATFAATLATAVLTALGPALIILGSLWAIYDAWKRVTEDPKGFLETMYRKTREGLGLDKPALGDQYTGFGTLQGKTTAEMAAMGAYNPPTLAQQYTEEELSAMGIPGYQFGGIVKGMIGRPIPAIVHGGEEVLTRSDSRHSANQGGAINIYVTGNTILNDNDADRLASKIVESITRRARMQQTYSIL